MGLRARSTRRRRTATGAGAIAGVLSLVVALAAPASASLTVNQISSDPFTNTGSAHQTEVEPDTFAAGATVVAAFQTGRFYDGGSSDIGYSISLDSGATWPRRGFLPSLTVNSSPAGPYARVSDPSVTFDKAHGRWLIASLLIDSSLTGVGVAVSASGNGGQTWSAPAVVHASASGSFDKDWIVCDRTSTSPYYGHCYLTWDDNANGNRLLTSTSTDGGTTWSAPAPTANAATGLGGQPLVRPDGVVIVPVDSADEGAVLSYRSTDGGASWSATTTVATVQQHAVAGGLRSGPLPSAAMDAAGTVYVAWQDCRFRAGCASNDIVFSTSTNGLTWSAVRRVAADAVTSTADHFIPGIAIAPTTSGTTAHLAVTYYWYPVAACTAATCQLDASIVTSHDGGQTWLPSTQINSTPMSLSWLPPTSEGTMVGDYISTSYAKRHPVAVVALAQPKDTSYHESMYAATL